MYKYCRYIYRIVCIVCNTLCCSPSRGSFLTGRYAWHLPSVRCNFIPSSIPEGVPLEYNMLPKHLATAGYKSHHVGKWHLGFHTPEYTPVGRGFDSSLGYLEGGEDHFTHWCGASKLDCGEKNPSSGATTGAFDLWNQSKARFPGAPVYGINGTAKDEATYSGFVFTQRAVDVIAGHPSARPSSCSCRCTMRTRPSRRPNASWTCTPRTGWTGSGSSPPW